MLVYNIKSNFNKRRSPGQRDPDKSQASFNLCRINLLMCKQFYSWVLLVNAKYITGLKIGALGGVILLILNFLLVFFSNTVAGGFYLLEIIIIIFILAMGALVVRSSRGSLNSIMDSITLSGITGAIASIMTTMIVITYYIIMTIMTIPDGISITRVLFSIFSLSFIAFLFTIIQNVILSVIGGGVYALLFPYKTLV